MSDKERSRGPSLELNLGFGRRKKTAAPEPAETTESVPEAPPEPEPAPEPAPDSEPGPTAAGLPWLPGTMTEPASFQHRQDPPAKSRRALPRLPGLVAAALTGLVIGALTVGATAVAERLCTLLRGTSSCGGPGFFLILLILAVLGFLGAYLLRAFGVPDPRSTSFLGLGLMAVLAILFLSDHLLDWWMAIAIPLLSLLGYVVSERITSAIVDIDDQRHR